MPHLMRHPVFCPLCPGRKIRNAYDLHYLDHPDKPCDDRGSLDHPDKPGDDRSDLCLSDRSDDDKSIRDKINLLSLKARISTIPAMDTKNKPLGRCKVSIFS